jgi:hypothetical protein
LSGEDSVKVQELCFAFRSFQTFLLGFKDIVEGDYAQRRSNAFSSHPPQAMASFLAHVFHSVERNFQAAILILSGSEQK